MLRVHANLESDLWRHSQTILRCGECAPQVPRGRGVTVCVEVVLASWVASSRASWIQVVGLSRRRSAVRGSRVQRRRWPSEGADWDAQHVLDCGGTQRSWLAAGNGTRVQPGQENQAGGTLRRGEAPDPPR